MYTACPKLSCIVDESEIFWDLHGLNIYNHSLSTPSKLSYFPFLIILPWKHFLMICLLPLSKWCCGIRNIGLKWLWYILQDFLLNSSQQLGMKTCLWNWYVFPITHCTSILWLYQFAECLGLLLRPICAHAYCTSTNPIMCPIHQNQFQSWGSPTGYPQYHLWNWSQWHKANPRALAKLAAKHCQYFTKWLIKMLGNPSTFSLDPITLWAGDRQHVTSTVTITTDTFMPTYPWGFFQSRTETRHV